MTLRVRALALAGGIVWGAYVFLATLWVMWFRDGAIIPMFMILYPGYGATLLGAIIGLAWGLFDGAFCGALLAWLYNRFHGVFYKTETAAR